jgi:hypothetical protein
MRYSELLPLRVDRSLEARGVVVSSEACGGEGETEDLNGLLRDVSNGGELERQRQVKTSVTVPDGCSATDA